MLAEMIIRRKMRQIPYFQKKIIVSEYVLTSITPGNDPTAEIIRFLPISATRREV